MNPFLDSDGLIRVGGRLKQSSLEWSVVHPILLPRKGSITKLIVKWCHEKAAHSGRNTKLEVPGTGYDKATHWQNRSEDLEGELKNNSWQTYQVIGFKKSLHSLTVM